MNSDAFVLSIASAIMAVYIVCFIIAVLFQPALRDPSDRVVGISQYLAISERRRQGSIVTVKGRITDG